MNLGYQLSPVDQKKFYNNFDRIFKKPEESKNAVKNGEEKNVRKQRTNNR